MRDALLFLICLMALQLFAQEKGVSPLPAGASAKMGQTYAVVVGISDYQDEAIPDLKYAHKDAEAFAAWLRSPAGGSVPESHLQVLIDKQATGAAVAGAIDWLVASTAEGDQAIIYFSGHGDVERRASTQPGFLLCWDSGPKIYMAGGTYSLYFLQDMVSTMSVDKNAKVMVIADACRSGKLAGSPVNGPQLTANNLARQYQNEIKILSCQPNEYSLEGEQWGGGRGAFSFHLVEGLTGLADANQDMLVKLLEIGRYLEDKVSREVAPLSQMPMTIGSRMENIATVDATALAGLLESKKHQTARLGDIEGKAHEALFATVADSGIQVIYTAFEKALKHKRYFEPADNCAEQYYSLLMAAPARSTDHSFIRRKYAVALQDDAQQSINAILKSDPDQILRTRGAFYESYKDFPKLLNRAARLLGEQHYMYNNLKAREHLFEGMLLYFKYKAAKESTTEQGNEVLAHYRKSLEYEPEFPVTHLLMSMCYGRMLNKTEQAQKYAASAVELAGTWTMPYVNLAYYLVKYSKQFDTAKKYLDLAMAMDSTDARVWKGWISWYAYQRKIPEALVAAQTAARLAPDDPYIWLNIGNLKQNQYKYAESEAALLKSIELDSTLQFAYCYLGINYWRWAKHEKDKFEPAEKYLLKALALDPEHELSRSTLAGLYKGFDKYAEAEKQYLELIKYADPNAQTWFNFAQVSTANGHHKEGLLYLENALKKGFKNQQKIEEEKHFGPLRALPGYQALMNKYFKE